MTRSVEVPSYEVHKEVWVDPKKTAVVIVDMQNDFVKEGGSLLVPGAEATVLNIQTLLDLARGSEMKVVFTQDTHTEGDPEWEIWPEHAREGSWGWEIVEELAPREDELVIRKVRYDAFYGTHLDHYLRVWDVDTLIICGTVANICVHYTAASAALRWYEVVIPKDAVSSLEEIDLEASLRQTSFLFAGKITEGGAVRVGRRSQDYSSLLGSRRGPPGRQPLYDALPESRARLLNSLYSAQGEEEIDDAVAAADRWLSDHPEDGDLRLARDQAIQRRPVKARD